MAAEAGHPLSATGQGATHGTDTEVGTGGGPAWAVVQDLAAELVSAWGCWAPTLTSDGSHVAFVSDRRGTPELWVHDGPEAQMRVLPLSSDPVLSAHWSPDSDWIACSVATGGGVRTEVWVVRPDGTDARRVAGGDIHAVLGPWVREGHGLVVTLCADEPDVPHACLVIDASSDTSEVVARGDLIHVLDLTADGRFALLRDGTRNAQFCRLVDREADSDFAVLPYPETGSTDIGLLRPAPPARAGEQPATLTAYLVTDAGLARRELVAIGVHEDGRRTSAGSLAGRADAELELADADADGRQILLVWNVAGRSEVEVLDTHTGLRRPCAGLPGDVVAGVAMARDGCSAVLSIEGPAAPRRLWHLDVGTLAWTAVTPRSLHTTTDLLRPELLELVSYDGLPISGWLYPARSNGDGPPPAMLSLHGGPEAQERPTFIPQHQVLAAAGITVFAPNVRGSSGFGRAFVRLDDRRGRLDAIADVVECARMLAKRGWADPARIAVTGRSYGGYATLVALTRHPSVFAAGVDICGMSDLLTFYRDTEPWIAAAAVSKYGDPVHDAALLAELSPLHQAEEIRVPLLVVHGELDTNVPLGEARQIVERLHELGHAVEYLELAGEGHEYRRVDSRIMLLATLTDFLGRVLR